MRKLTPHVSFISISHQLKLNLSTNEPSLLLSLPLIFLRSSISNEESVLPNYGNRGCCQGHNADEVKPKKIDDILNHRSRYVEDTLYP